MLLGLRGSRGPPLEPAAAEGGVVCVCVYVRACVCARACVYYAFGLVHRQVPCCPPRSPRTAWGNFSWLNS